MTTLAELVLLEPDPTHGYQIQIPAESGVWRWVVELADPSAGSYVEWLDVTEWYVGDRHQMGADQYMGDNRARVVNVQLQIDESDLLAPWGLDTTELFGVDVVLDAGLLMRASLARVVSAEVVEWLPVWTGRVESWGDSSFARGQTRVHDVVLIDTTADLANVPTVIEENDTPWGEWYEDLLLPEAGWSFGVDIYGDTSSVNILQDLNMVAAHTRMEQVADPIGLVWRSLRSGRLVIHPAPWDTTNTNRYDNPLLDVYPAGLVFSFSPDVTEIEYIADDDQRPFGVERTVVGVLNSFTVTRPDTTVYAIDDPVSVDKFGVRPFTTTWIIENDPAVDDLLAARAYASIQALPLRTTLEHEGFFPALAMLDHLDPVTVEHAAADARPVVTVAGTVRSIVEERTFQGSADGVATLAWQSTVQIDVTASTAADALLPVESLALVATSSPGTAGPSSAEFSWVNPTQPTVTPTEVETRILERSLIWTAEDYPGVGADGTTVNWLAAETQYTFQVRLVRRVDGIATHVSPIREIIFTTPARIWPIPVPDGEDTGGEFGEPPDFDPDDCELEVDLQENDGTGWVTVDTFTDAELTDNGDGTWSLTTPIPNSFFNDGSQYRYQLREICGTVVGDWIVGPEWDPPDDWTDPCPAPSALGEPPYDDPNLIVYVPKICSGAEDADPNFVFNGLMIVEAVSNIAGTAGSALAEVLQNIADPGHYTLHALDDPAWSDAAGGILAYGECPQTTGKTGDKSILIACSIADDTVGVVLGECAAMQLSTVPVSGGGFRFSVTVYKPGSTITLPSTNVFDVDTPYWVAATHELATGDIILYVNTDEENTVGGTDNVPTINALPVWRVGAPPGSWVTDFAVFDRVLAQAELPGVPPVTVTINQGSGQADPTTGSSITFDVVFSEAVTGFATGDVTLSGTAGATTGTVSGSGATYTVSVTGMTAAGTVIATINAAVCTSVATGEPNEASTSTDNTVTWSFDPVSGIPWMHLWYVEGPEFAALGLTNGNVAASWPDEIGTLDASGLPGDRPTYRSSDSDVNNQPSLDFDGTDNMITGTETETSPPFSIVAIANILSAGNDHAFITDGATSTDRVTIGGNAVSDASAGHYQLYNGTAILSSGDVGNNAPHLFTGYCHTSSGVLEVDGTSVATGGTGSQGFTGLRFATRYDNTGSGSRMTGPIVLIGIIAGDVRTQTNWTAFENWAEAKYGMTIA